MAISRFLPSSPFDFFLGVLTALILYSGALQVTLYLLLGIAPVLGNALFGITAIAAAIFVVRRFSEIPIDGSFLIIVGLWVAYLIWATFCAGWTTSSDIAGDKLLNLVGYSSGFLVIGLTAGYSAYVLNVLRRTVILLGGVTAVAALFAATRGAGKLVMLAKQHGALAIFVNSYQSTTLCIGMASTFALIELVSSKRGRDTLLWGCVWGALSLATLAGGGRGAAIGCGFAQLAILVLSFFAGSDSPARKRAIGILVTLPAIAGVTFLIAMQLQLRTLTRLANFASTSTDSTGRLTLWRRAMAMADQHPLFGAGFGSYEGTANNFVNPGLYPHNLFIEVLAETGVVGLFLVGAMVVVTFICVLRKMEHIAFVSMAVWLGLFVEMMVEANVSGTVTDHFFAFSLGMSAGLISRTCGAPGRAGDAQQMAIGRAQFN